MSTGSYAAADRGPWHLHAVRLPDDSEATHWWIADGLVGDRAVAGARDVPGGWFLPGGLVDAHVHLTMNFGKVMPHPDGSDALIRDNAAAQRRAGVLALRDAGYAWGAVPRESADGPRLQRAGSLIAPPGRGYPNVCRLVSPDDLVGAALEEVAAGAAWIKVLADFPGADGNWFAAPANYPREVLSAMVREVHAAGSRVMGHSTGLGAAELVSAGADSIEHGMALTRDLLAEMAERRIAWTLTLATADKHVGSLAEQQSPVGVYIRSQLDRIRELLPLAVDCGVPVLAGTDEIPMGALGQELQFLSRFGLTPSQTLAAGSTAARTWLGFSPFAAGAPADLVTYDADPRRDLAVLGNPAAVVFSGQRVR